MASRKRRRSVAFAPDDGDATPGGEVETPFDDALQSEGKVNSRAWGAFCEEYHEGTAFLLATLATDKKKVLEQLPLTLQRAFILIHELDDQSRCEPSALEYIY